MGGPSQSYKDFCDQLDIEWEEAWKEGLTFDDLNEFQRIHEYETGDGFAWQRDC